MIRWMRGAPALDNIKPQPSQYWGIFISIIYSIERSPKKARLPPTGLSSGKHCSGRYVCLWLLPTSPTSLPMV